jgi:hypothetical protein
LTITFLTKTFLVICWWKHFWWFFWQNHFFKNFYARIILKNTFWTITF